MADATRDEELWAGEVVQILKNAPSFDQAARLMLCDVLASLIKDRTLDQARRRDVWRMLEAISRPRLVEVA